MAEPLDEKGLTTQLRTLIRYLASGLIAILVFNVMKYSFSVIPKITEANWSLLIVASLIGLVNYCLHAALLDNFFYENAVKCIISKYEEYKNYIPDIIHSKAIEKSGKTKVILKAELNEKIFN